MQNHHEMRFQPFASLFGIVGGRGWVRLSSTLYRICNYILTVSQTRASQSSSSVMQLSYLRQPALPAGSRIMRQTTTPTMMKKATPWNQIQNILVEFFKLNVEIGSNDSKICKWNVHTAQIATIIQVEMPVPWTIVQNWNSNENWKGQFCLTEHFESRF